jgi:hypothetical protein
MKDYEFKLVPKCYTKPGRLNRPRRCKSHCVKISMRNTWGPLAMEILKERGTLGLSAV